MAAGSFYLAYALAAFLIGWGAYYFYKNHREKLGAMDTMMGGMVYGSITGLAFGAIYAVTTGDYLWASIIGTVAGLLVGVPLGRATGGGLARLEGVMAGPMGGLMGAMLGFMVRPFDLRLFMVFLFGLIILIVGEMSYHVYKCCERKTPKMALYLAGLVALSIVGVVAIQDYPVDFNQGIGIASASGNPAKEVQGAVLEGKQEINLQASFTGYNPSTIKLKKGIPVQINFGADNNAGCARALQIPDFGVSAIVKPGEVKQLSFTPEKAGTYDFYCAMRMFRGKIIVE